MNAMMISNLFIFSPPSYQTKKKALIFLKNDCIERFFDFACFLFFILLSPLSIKKPIPS